MLDAIDNFLGKAIKGTAIGIAALLVYLLGKELWKEFGDDVKAYVSTQWQAFVTCQNKARFLQWCKKVVEALSLKGYSWTEKSKIFTEVDRNTMQANTVFQYDKQNAFKSDGYVIVDGDASGSFIRSTGEIVEMTDLMARVLHQGVV